MGYERLMHDLSEEQFDLLMSVIAGSISVTFDKESADVISVKTLGIGGANALIMQHSGECKHYAQVLVLEAVIDLLENAHSALISRLMEARRDMKIAHHRHNGLPRRRSGGLENLLSGLLGLVDEVMPSAERREEIKTETLERIRDGLERDEQVVVVPEQRQPKKSILDDAPPVKDDKEEDLIDDEIDEDEDEIDEDEIDEDDSPE